MIRNQIWRLETQNCFCLFAVSSNLWQRPGISCNDFLWIIGVTHPVNTGDGNSAPRHWRYLFGLKLPRGNFRCGSVVFSTTVATTQVTHLVRREILNTQVLEALNIFSLSLSFSLFPLFPLFLSLFPLSLSASFFSLPFFFFLLFYLPFISFLSFPIYLPLSWIWVLMNWGWLSNSSFSLDILLPFSCSSSVDTLSVLTLKRSRISLLRLEMLMRHRGERERDRYIGYFKVRMVGTSLHGKCLSLLPAGQPWAVGKVLWLDLDVRLCCKINFFVFVFTAQRCMKRGGVKGTVYENTWFIKTVCLYCKNALFVLCKKTKIAVQYLTKYTFFPEK